MLMDDFGAELDAGGRSRLLGALGRMGVQAFVTGVSKEGFDLGNWADRKVFHVEQGEVAEMV